MTRRLLKLQNRIRLLGMSIIFSILSMNPSIGLAQEGEEAAPSGFLSILFSGGIVGMIMILILLLLSFTAQRQSADLPDQW